MRKEGEASAKPTCGKLMRPRTGDNFPQGLKLRILNKYFRGSVQMWIIERLIIVHIYSYMGVRRYFKSLFLDQQKRQKGRRDAVPCT